MRARYEEGLIVRALDRHGLAYEPRPEGKRIEAVVVEAYPVIMRDDFPLSSKIPWTLANYLHVRTRDPVIARELLFAPGQRFATSIVDESERNLRSNLFLSVARIVAARGSAPDRVVVLVVTKDLWSLRLNSNFTTDQDRLDYLSLSFSENNFLGRNKYLAVNFALDPGRYTLGLSYNDPRLFGSRHALQATANMYLDRQDSSPEGAYVFLALGRPLFSLRTRWAWQARFSFLQDKARDFLGGDLRLVPGGPQCTFDKVRGYLGPQCVPHSYGRRQIAGTLSVTHSYGVRSKLNLTAGLRVYSYQNYLTGEFPAAASPAVRDYYLTNWVPVSEQGAGPYFTLVAYRASYAQLKDVDTFALSEDWRIGPYLSLELRYASHYLGLSSDYAEFIGSYNHSFLFGDDLFYYTAGLSGRLQPGTQRFGSMLVNETASFGVRNVSPRLRFLRLHLSFQLSLRNHDLNNTLLTLGSDNALRAFASRSFSGYSLYLLNAELRTLALNLWTVHVGAVLFYDGGDAPSTLAAGTWHQDVGAGVRVLLPQFNRDVIRVDLAVPLPPDAAGVRVTASWGQAF